MPSRRYLEWGRAWSFLEGEESTQTQYASSDDGVQVWNHPIDAHFASASIQGWPRMVMQVWELDEYGRSILAGYGFAHLPTNAGESAVYDCLILSCIHLLVACGCYCLLPFHRRVL